MERMGCDRCLFHPRCFFSQAESASDEFRSAPGRIDGMRIGHGCENAGVRPPHHLKFGKMRINHAVRGTIFWRQSPLWIIFISRDIWRGLDVFRSVWYWECLKSPPNAPKLMPSGHQTWLGSSRTSENGHFDGTIIKKWGDFTLP
jgi:hypothetical protein